MKKVMILTDSTSDISKALQIKHDIQVIPLFIRFEEEVFLDGIDINPNALYQKVFESKVMARSSGLRSTDFNTEFKKYLARGYDVIYIGVGSDLSSSFQSAEIAKKSMDSEHIFLVDSKNISAGLSLLVFKGVDLRNQGLSAAQIKQELDHYIFHIQSFYVITSLAYLKMGKKINALQSFLSRLIKLRPIITVINGKVELYQKPFGNIDQVIKKFMKSNQQLHPRIDQTRMIITESSETNHLECVKDALHTYFLPKQIIESEMGCVISAHTGPNTLGFAYFENDKGTIK